MASVAAMLELMPLVKEYRGLKLSWVHRDRDLTFCYIGPAMERGHPTIEATVAGEIIDKEPPLFVRDYLFNLLDEGLEALIYGAENKEEDMGYCEYQLPSGASVNWDGETILFEDVDEESVLIRPHDLEALAAYLAGIAAVKRVPEGPEDEQ